MNNTVSFLREKPRVCFDETARVSALVLDDSEFDRQHIRRLSRASNLPIQLREADTIAAMRTALEVDEYDVVLIDYNLPQGNGIEALEAVRNSTRNAKAAAIMITGNDRSNVAVDALKRGCADYLSKTALTEESLKSAIVTAINATRLEAMRNRRFDLDVDKLTAQIMSQFSRALQPEVASVVRSLRDLKSMLRDPQTNVSGSLEKIENQCIGLWSHLLSPEEFPGA